MNLSTDLSKAIEGFIASHADRGDAAAKSLLRQLLGEAPQLTPAATYRAGTLVLSINGELNELDDQGEVHTGPLALGYIDVVYPDQSEKYSVVFPATGHAIFLNQEEIEDEAQYRVVGALGEGDVMGIDADGNVLVWAAEPHEGKLFNCGEDLDSYGVAQLSNAELMRLRFFALSQNQSVTADA